MTLPTLKVPTVPAGDVGLVLELNGIAAEPHTQFWCILTIDGRVYRLPSPLWSWAKEIEAAASVRELRMPALVAFREVDGEMTAEMLSRS